MTKKRKRWPDLQQKLDRPWCYYCDRDFDDMKILVSHQKAKHFKCEKCGRRLNTAGGLNVHMTQVHKEQLTIVQNANAGRGNIDIEIFGLEGIPAEAVEAHQRDITQKHFTEQAERERKSGNVARDMFGNHTNNIDKKKRVKEDISVIKERADKYRVDKINGVLPAPAVQEVNSQPAAPFTTSSQPFPPGQLPPPPGSASPAGILPQRPGFAAPLAAPPGLLAPPPAAHAAPDLAASVDDLISGAAGEADAATNGSGAAAVEKKSKKDRNMRMLFGGENGSSPEERMAEMTRFGWGDEMET